MRTLVVETRLCLSELRTTYNDLDVQVTEHRQLCTALLEESPAKVKSLIRHHLDDAVARLTSNRATRPE